jgi:hypothetical protein
MTRGSERARGFQFRVGDKEVEREGTCNLSALAMSFSGSDDELDMAETTASSSSSPPLLLPDSRELTAAYAC